MLAASLRERVRSLWRPELHPRGRDGEFIEKGGFVSGTVRWNDGSVEHASRVEVIDVTPAKSYTEATDLGGRVRVREGAPFYREGIAYSMHLRQAAAPRANLADMPAVPPPAIPEDIRPYAETVSRTAQRRAEAIRRREPGWESLVQIGQPGVEVLPSAEGPHIRSDPRFTTEGAERTEELLRRQQRRRSMAASIDDTFWEDGLAIEATVEQGLAAALRSRVKGTDPLLATATSAWNAEARRKAASKGIALSDGSFPIADKTDWYKARQAIGRAKPGKRAAVRRHLIKRGRALGIPKTDIQRIQVKVGGSKGSSGPSRRSNGVSAHGLGAAVKMCIREGNCSGPSACVRKGNCLG